MYGERDAGDDQIERLISTERHGFARPDMRFDVRGQCAHHQCRVDVDCDQAVA